MPNAGNDGEERDLDSIQVSDMNIYVEKQTFKKKLLKHLFYS